MTALHEESSFSVDASVVTISCASVDGTVAEIQRVVFIGGMQLIRLVTLLAMQAFRFADFAAVQTSVIYLQIGVDFDDLSHVSGNVGEGKEPHL